MEKDGTTNTTATRNFKVVKKPVVKIEFWWEFNKNGVNFFLERSVVNDGLYKVEAAKPYDRVFNEDGELKAGLKYCENRSNGKPDLLIKANEKNYDLSNFVKFVPRYWLSN